MLQHKKHPIYKYRKNHSLSQRRFGLLAEPTFSTNEIYRFENGIYIPTYPIVKRLAGIMNVEPLDLMSAILLWAYEDTEMELYDKEGNKI